MNSKNVLMLLVVVLVIGGLFVYFKKSSVTAPTSVVPTASSVSPTVAKETGAMTKETTVTATATGFDPQKVTVKVRSKITWVNKSGGVSNVSSAKHPTHLVYPPLNLGDFQDGASVSLVFDKPGVYKYHNHLEPTQFGTVEVVE